MPKKTLAKILLDITMTVLYILLMFGYNISPLFHELFGIIVGILFVIHLWLNKQLWTGMRKTYAKGNLSAPNKRKMIYDIVLIISMPVVIFTGIIISGELLSMQFNLTIFSIHKISSYISLVVLALHVGTHAKYLTNALSKLFKKENAGLIGKFAGATVLIVAIYMGISRFMYGSNPYVPVPSQAENETPTAVVTEIAPTDDSQNDASGYDSTQDVEITEQPSTEPPAQTLADYLGSLYCTGCGKHCSLLAPKCGIGMEQVQEAEADYYEIYAEAASE